MSARCPCTRAGLPAGARQCALCDLDEVNGKPTVRPPADQRCTRCDRILLSAPCGCTTPVERAVALRLAAEDADDALTPAQRIEARRVFNAAMRERTALRLAQGPG